MKIGLNNNLFLSGLPTKFLGLAVDSMLSWKIHVNHLTIGLNTACYGI